LTDLDLDLLNLRFGFGWSVNQLGEVNGRLIDLTQSGWLVGWLKFARMIWGGIWFVGFLVVCMPSKHDLCLFYPLDGCSPDAVKVT
jgi:hypothetical protein